MQYHIKTHYHMKNSFVGGLELVPEGVGGEGGGEFREAGVGGGEDALSSLLRGGGPVAVRVEERVAGRGRGGDAGPVGVALLLSRLHPACQFDG